MNFAGGVSGRGAVARVFLATALLAGCASGGAARAPATAGAGGWRQVPAVRGAEVFDSAWTRIHRSHYDSTFRGVDWHAVRQELRPRAERAADADELRAVIRAMLERLGESHYAIIPGDLADAVDGSGGATAGGPPGDAGLQLRLVDGAVMVTEVAQGGPAQAAGVRPGWVVENVGGRALGPSVQRLLDADRQGGSRMALSRFLWGLNGLLDGPAGSTVGITFRDGENRSVRLDLRRRAQPGEPVRLGNLPTFVARLESRAVDTGAGCIGVIRFNVWMIPIMRLLDRAVDELRACQGMIVDLRGNPGGVAGMLMGVAGHFLREAVPLGVMRSRSGELRFVANPRRVSAEGRPVEPYGGPLAVLVDPMTASSSEFFAGGMQAIGRAHVFGDTTAGQALPAVASRLPNDDVLMYVVADYADPQGRRFEGGGVAPDVVVPLVRADLLAGRDPVMDAAFDWLVRAAAAGRSDEASGNGPRPSEPVRTHDGGPR